MTFQSAVQATPSVCKAYEGGLKALGKYSLKVCCKKPHQLTGSINLEKALRRREPKSPLWDYGIGYRTRASEKAIWIEVHSASSTHVKDVLNKLRWLKNWLRLSAPELHALTHGDFYWIATGKIAITAHSPQAKQLAAEGLQGPMKRLYLEE
ncbi:MAG: hypothetical protein N3D11_13675 [Candidatus Sumerlaeia bacterium]|nr:hypothetical protein [Candidatus Sumerlaeia bacterium]